MVFFFSAYLLRKYSSTSEGGEGQNASAATLEQHGSSRVAGTSVTSGSNSHGYERIHGVGGSHPGSRGDNNLNYNKLDFDGQAAATGGDVGRTIGRNSEAEFGGIQDKTVTFRTVSD